MTIVFLLSSPRAVLRAACLGAALSAAAPGLAAAQTPDPTPQIKAIGQCEACTLTAQDLRTRHLMGIDLARATITDVRFDQAELSISVFDGAQLERVSFDGADLRGASFVRARLVDVSFAGADLRGAVFEEATLERTDLHAARLCNTQLPEDVMDNTHCN